MKNGITVTIRIAAFVALTTTAVACNDSAVADDMTRDQCVVELDECNEAEDSAWLYAADVENECSVTYKKTEIAFFDLTDELEQCKIQRDSWENETFRIAANIELNSEQSEGLEQRYNSAYDALQAVPLDVRAYLCSVGNWDAWICESLNAEQ